MHTVKILTGLGISADAEGMARKEMVNFLCAE